MKGGFGASLAILAGAALLLWPALLNGYPIVFSDTGAGFLAQTVPGIFFIWDKPFVYGPALHALHWRWSLWPAVAAQALLLAWLLRLTLRAVLGRAPAGAVLALCAGLALLTAAPWFVALLMPDMLAPSLVLCLFLLGFAADTLGRAERVGVVLAAAFAAAVHLAHLPIAAALILLVLLVRRRIRPALACLLPLALAIGVLLATNLAGHGRLAVSPYGAVFALARLVGDGPAARTIAAGCPARGWHVCGWAGELPTDSDEFMWDPESPVWAAHNGGPPTRGPIAFAPEAGAIVAETLRRDPVGVLRAVVANTLRQLARARVGDVLGPDHLLAAFAPRLAMGFPPAEGARFAAGRQAGGTLAAAAAPWLPVHAVVLVFGAAAALLAWWRAAAVGDPRRLGLVLCVLVGVTANAAATGALSGPHDRYGARIAWLLPLAGVLGLLPMAARGPARLAHAGD